MKKIKNIKVVLMVFAAITLVGVVAVLLPNPSKPSNTLIYTDTDYGFSFSYPENYKPRAFSDLEDTKTILIENSDTNQGAQVFVSPFDEDIVLTPERIKKEVPDLVVLEPQNRSLGGVTGVVFRSTNALNTESKELWMVHKNNLYQISLPAQAGVPVAQQTSPELFDTIVTTWHWNE